MVIKENLKTTEIHPKLHNPIIVYMLLIHCLAVHASLQKVCHVAVCLRTFWRYNWLSEAILCNARNTYSNGPGAKISQVSVSYNSNRAAYVTIACRCSFGKGTEK